MILKDFEIIKIEALGLHHYRIRLFAPGLTSIAKPGQFLHIRINDGIDPLLRRPFSIHRIVDDGVEILFRVVGKGTRLLSKKRVGERLNLLGPLGNGFRIREDKGVVLVAGGIGIAPLFFLAEKLTKSKHPLTLLIGAKTKGEILCEDELRGLGVDVRIATEDGSYGNRGLVTDLLHTLHPTHIYACGPVSMLKKVTEFAKWNGISCQVSLETRMGCGVGACLGCAVKIGSSYKYVCRDGPVFEGV